MFKDYINNLGLYNQSGGSKYLCNSEFFNIIKETLTRDDLRSKNFKEIYIILIQKYALLKELANDDLENQTKYARDMFICIMLLSFLIEYEIHLLIFKDNKIEYGYNIDKEYKGKYPQLATYEEFIENQKLVVHYNYYDEGLKLIPLYNKKNVDDEYHHYRSIIKHLSSNIDLLLDYFCEKMDNFINTFLELLVKDLEIKFDNRVKDEMFENCIINIDNIKSNWMNSNYFINNKDEVDKSIIKIIKFFHNDTNKYIADGIGFFSWLFLFYKKGNTNKPSNYLDYNGSCITSTLLEHFLLTIIYYPTDKINLVLQQEYDIIDKNKIPPFDNIQVPLHRYHLVENKGFYKENSLIIPTFGYSISHWSTKIIKYSDNQPEYFRFFIKIDNSAFSYYPDINIIKNSKEYFIAFVYECFDYYTELMNKNKDIIGNNYVEQINKFFNDERIKLFDDNIRI
jgi:hypothetical protein